MGLTCTKPQPALGKGREGEKETEELKIALGAAFFLEIIFLPGHFIS